MKGVGLKLTLVVVRHLIGPPSMFGPMAETSWTHSYIVQTVLTESLTHLQLPTLPHRPQWL